ncbi:MAG: hypothetical protein ACP6IY_14965 [Promethearchaeia archaeon]
MISPELETLIDKAVSRDFIIHKINEEDHQNDSYRALKFTLDFNNIEIEYERKVESDKYPIIPRYQYLFGFIPHDGLCIYVNKEAHKKALCDGPMENISKTCSLIHSLYYLLVPADKFVVYTYFPACCEINCLNSPKAMDLRIKLFNRDDNS